MKNPLFILALLAISVSAKAQRDAFDSTEYVFGLPTTNDDTVGQTFPDRSPKDVLIRVPDNEIPKRLRRALDREELYEGWEKRGVFRDRNTGLFVISIRDEASTRTYGLNENGKPVTFDEHSLPRDSIE